MKTYSLIIVGISIVAGCVQMITAEKPIKRVSFLLSMLLAIPVFYYIWVT